MAAREALHAAISMHSCKDQRGCGSSSEDGEVLAEQASRDSSEAAVARCASSSDAMAS